MEEARRPAHALGVLLQVTEKLLAQETSVVEWAVQWECCLRDVQSSNKWPSRLLALPCLDCLKDFAESGQLVSLDRGLAELRLLSAEWDHHWWVAERQGTSWPTPARADEFLQVTRQAGRSRVSWQCIECSWSLSWDVETAAWQVLDWPGVLECPICSTASNDGRRAGENPQTVCER